MTIRNLVSTKTKREAIAKRLEAIAQEHGATFERRPGYFDNPHEMWVVTIALGPYRVGVRLDGKTNNTALIGAWHVSIRGGNEPHPQLGWMAATYPRDFDITIGGSMNRYHFGKATTCAETVDQLCRSIGDGLGRLAYELEHAKAA